MDTSLLNRLRNKDKLMLTDDYVPLRDSLKKVNPILADALRDAIWHINGKWHGVGLWGVSPCDIVNYAVELEELYKNGKDIPLCE